MNFQLESIIEVLLSSDNQKRMEAEAFINNLPATNFEQGINQLLKVMNSSNSDVAQMAALLLKKKYFDVKENLQMISKEKFEFIIQNIQNTMTLEKKGIYLRRCCDILVIIYIAVNQKGELLELVKTLASSQNTNIKLTLMYLIEIICEFAFDDKLLMEHSGSLEHLFQKGLQDENNDVRVASFKTLTIFLSSINDENLVKRFQNVLGLLLTKCIEAIKYDQQSGKTALESINELIQTHPKFIKPITNDLIMIFSEIMETNALNENLRISAMYGVYLLCMNHEASIRKNQIFKNKMVGIYMKMLSENEKITLEEWASELNDEVISKSSIPMATEQHLSQILGFLGVKFMLPLFIPYIQYCLASQNENQQHAGLVAMSILTEGSRQIFKNELNNIMNLILPLTNTQSPRIMHDVIHTFGYLSEQFYPDIQINYGEKIMQIIGRGLICNMMKLQYKSIQCITSFSKPFLDQQHKQHANIIDPYMEKILIEISKIFSANVTNFNHLMLEAILDVLSTLATIRSFEKYYQSFMPSLKQLISMMSGQDTQKVIIRSKTIESIGYLLTSIKTNQQLFVPECKNIMESLIFLANSLEKDDPLHSAMFTVYEQVAGCLKENFVYAEKIIDRVLYAVDSNIDVKILDQTDNINNKKKNNRVLQFKLDLKLDGVKNIIFNTQSLQMKIEGAGLLLSLCEYMGQSFAPFIQKSIPCVAKLLDYKYNQQIRHNMITAVKFMVLDCQNINQKQYVLTQLLSPLMNELMTVIKKKDDEQISLIMDVVSEIIPFCNEQMMNNMPALLNSVLTVVKSNIEDIQKQYAQKDMDEAVQAEMQEMIDEVEEIYEKVEKIIKVSGQKEFLNLKKMFPTDYEFDVQ